MRNNNCPECGLILSAGRCNACGYAQAKPKGDNHRCAYESMSDRCPLAGTITDSTKPGPDTSWYCAEHYHSKGSPKMAQQILYQIQRGEIKPNPKCWAEQMIDAKLAELRKTNPELFFHPANEQEMDEYHEMMMGFTKKIPSAAKPLPYNKHKPVETNEDAILTGHEVAA